MVRLKQISKHLAQHTNQAELFGPNGVRPAWSDTISYELSGFKISIV